ncbi:MAG: glycoside hydrolase family 32 protein [Thomasclavelia sp.]|nr:glycoside hydrolase family 32 protein [Thomasclavelia sp.]
MEKLKKEIEEALKNIPQDDNRLDYHLMPPIGWLNDPNGLCEYKGTYHIYYQYSPTDPKGADKMWGQYTTKDFIHYQSQPIFVYPDNEYDKDGVYSGSAVVLEDKIKYFYTGNVKHLGNYDYIYEGRGHNVLTLESKDGITVDKKECILVNDDYPSDLSCHVRDPKIIKIGDTNYLVLGARTKDDIGCVLIFKSKDLTNFKYETRINSKTPFGFMWECPDLFRINNQYVLMTCPQGVKKDKPYQYENVYQNGYFLVNDDFLNNPVVDNFIELDCGFDFYAPQTFLDEKGRRILIGWFGLPDIPYTNPTVSKGWQHCLTLPRELGFSNGHLTQKVIDEIKDLRKETIDFNKPLKNNIFEMHFKFNSEFEIDLRKDCKLVYQNKLLTLSFKDSGYGRDSRHIQIDSIDSISIYSDTSTLEIFINDGFKSMSTRIYDQDTSFKVKANDFKVEGYYLDKFIID